MGTADNGVFFSTSGRSWNWSASDDGGALAIETGGVLVTVAAVTSTYKTEDERGTGHKKKHPYINNSWQQLT